MPTHYIKICDIVDPEDKQGRTYREINLAKKHKYKLGDLVEIVPEGVRGFIVKVARDCDESLGYYIDFEMDNKNRIPYGLIGEESLNLIRRS